MEVKNWNPRPGQVWVARQRVCAYELLSSVLRRNDLLGFFAWICAKTTAWLFWAGPILFLAILIALPLVAISFLLLFPLRMFFQIIPPLAPLGWLEKIHFTIIDLLEDYTEVALNLAFRIDNKIERLSFF